MQSTPVLYFVCNRKDSEVCGPRPDGRVVSLSDSRPGPVLIKLEFILIQVCAQTLKA